MPKNYYIILGIPEDSSQADVKSAYRRLAKEFHPDHYGNNQNRFQVIHEAYSVLGDPALRRRYDASLQGSIAINRQRFAETLRRNPGADQIEPLIPEQVCSAETALDRSIHYYSTVFDDLFDRMLGSFTERGGSEGIRLKNITVEIVLTPEQASRGGNVRLNLPVQMRCPSCQSFGLRGSRNRNCWRCSGSGYLTGEKPVLINYPAGIGQHHTIRLALEPLAGQSRDLTAVFTVEEQR